MRALVVVALVSSAALISSPASARDYPICLNYVHGRLGAVERCEFSTVEQCRFAALGLQGSCAVNWRYPPPKKQPRREPR